MARMKSTIEFYSSDNTCVATIYQKTMQRKLTPYADQMESVRIIPHGGMEFVFDLTWLFRIRPTRKVELSEEEQAIRRARALANLVPANAKRREKLRRRKEREAQAAIEDAED